jgi:predicted DNA-binding transcriptional regulator AlpA
MKKYNMITQAELARQIGIPSYRLMTWANFGKIPPPTRIGPKCTVWDEETAERIKKWVKAYLEITKGMKEAALSDLDGI